MHVVCASGAVRNTLRGFLPSGIGMILGMDVFQVMKNGWVSGYEPRVGGLARYQIPRCFVGRHPLSSLLDNPGERSGCHFAEGSMMFWLLDSLGVLGCCGACDGGWRRTFISSGIKSGEKVRCIVPRHDDFVAANPVLGTVEQVVRR